MESRKSAANATPVSPAISETDDLAVIGLAARVTTLVKAAVRSDWQRVRRLSREVAHSETALAYPLIARAAMQLSAKLDGPFDEWPILCDVVRLAEACGQVRYPVERRQVG